MFETSEPPEIARMDPASAGPAYDAAPPAVRRAAAWLATHAADVTRRQSQTWGSIGLMFGSFAVAFGVALASRDALATGLAFTALFGPGLTWALALQGQGAAIDEWASDVIGRWDALVAIAPLEPATTPLLARIDALAGHRFEARDGARRAAERMRRLEVEFEHLERVGDPAMVAVRDRVRAEIADTHADLTALYAALVDLDAVRDADATRAVEQAVHRVRAEREVIALGS